MKRSGPIERKSELARKTPLTAKKALERSVAWSVPGRARSALHQNQATQRHEPKRRPAVKPAVPMKVRIALALRSGGVCEMALPGCTVQATDPAHRVRTGMGGRRGAAKAAHDVLSNLVHACRRCHSWTHAEPTAAGHLGLMLRDGDDPSAESCMYRGKRRWLADDGSVLTTNPTEEVTMPAARFRKKPVEISAIRWTGENAEELRDFTEGRFDVLDEYDRKNCDDPEATAQVFDVLHSTWVLVQTGDWIIGDIFAATYDRAA